MIQEKKNEKGIHGNRIHNDYDDSTDTVCNGTVRKRSKSG